MQVSEPACPLLKLGRSGQHVVLMRQYKLRTVAPKFSALVGST